MSSSFTLNSEFRRTLTEQALICGWIDRVRGDTIWFSYSGGQNLSYLICVGTWWVCFLPAGSPTIRTFNRLFLWSVSKYNMVKIICIRLHGIYHYTTYNTDHSKGGFGYWENINKHLNTLHKTEGFPHNP